MENVRKPKDIKFESTEIRRTYLLSEPNHHATKCFTEYLIVIAMGKTQILINYLSLSLSI